MQEITSEELYGISKRINKELESLPLHTHSAIVEMVKVGMQHRNLVMQKADRDAQQEKENRVIRLKEQEVERYNEQQRERAKNAPVLVESPPPN